MNKTRYHNMLATLEKQKKANINKIYPDINQYPRRFDILGKDNAIAASFYFANIDEGYRYRTDKGGLSKEHVPLEIVRDCFKYFKCKKYI